MIFDCTTLKTAIKIYCRESRLNLANVNLYTDSGLSGLYVNDFRIFGNGCQAQYKICDSLKGLICSHSDNATIELVNLRIELEKIAPFRILHFIDVIKKTDFPVKYKIQLYEI